MTNLQKMRKSRNFSQSELARAAKINIRTLQHYEQGAKLIDNARLNTIVKLCTALNCNIEDILENPKMLDSYYN